MTAKSFFQPQVMNIQIRLGFEIDHCQLEETHIVFERFSNQNSMNKKILRF